MHFKFNAGPTLCVRSAEASDASAVERLYRELVPSDDAIHVLPERLEEIAGDRNSLLLVADNAGQIVGSALLTICLDPMYQRQPYGLVENVVVADAERSDGVGGALMRALKLVAEKQDCSKLMLLSNSKRTRAHSFFERNGFDGGIKRGFVLYRAGLNAG